MTRNPINVTAHAGVFSEIEEEFFRRGDEGTFAIDDFSDLDEDDRPTSMTEPRVQPRVEEDDDWDWQIAIARARLVDA